METSIDIAFLLQHIVHGKKHISEQIRHVSDPMSTGTIYSKTFWIIIVGKELRLFANLLDHEKYDLIQLVSIFPSHNRYLLLLKMTSRPFGT